MINNISFYIHWPWCDYICNFCDFYKFKTDKNINYERIFKCYIRDFESLCESEGIKIKDKVFLNKNGNQSRFVSINPNLMAVEGVYLLEK